MFRFLFHYNYDNCGMYDSYERWVEADDEIEAYRKLFKERPNVFVKYYEVYDKNFKPAVL